MIKNFIKELGIEFYENISLKKYNTYRLDTIAKYLVFPDSKENLKSLLQFLVYNNIKYVVLGNGSNVIFHRDFYDGVVILLNKFNKVNINDNVVEVEAGYFLPKLALEVSRLGLEGLEFAAAIPGFVGASVAMNAGAYNSSLSEVVESVVAIDPEFNIVELKRADLQFSYRSSLFKIKREYIIISVIMKLKYGDAKELLEKIDSRRIKRVMSQPLDMPSAGSVFRNPLDMYAGELIEKCSLKGCCIGGALVSLKHANFIVNNGNARGSDIVLLINKIKNDVKLKFGVELELEQIIID